MTDTYNTIAEFIEIHSRKKADENSYCKLSYEIMISNGKVHRVKVEEDKTYSLIEIEDILEK